MKRQRQSRECNHVQAGELSDVELVGLVRKALSPGPKCRRSRQAPAFLCVVCGAVHAQRVLGSEGVKPACGHALTLDQERLELFCLKCNDYVYLEQFDEAVTLATAHHLLHKGQLPQLPDHDPAPAITSKRQKLRQEDARADPDTEAQGAATGLQDLAAQAWESLVGQDGHPLGLRGLNNLGNTCFMNSVLQVLFHAPLLRNFYLGEGHCPATCRATRREKPCLSCQMDSIFSEVYSGNRSPLSPATFLYHWWLFADSLAGDKQQDAHEFYLSLLEGLAGSTIAGGNADGRFSPLPDELSQGCCNGASKCRDDDQLSMESGYRQPEIGNGLHQLAGRRTSRCDQAGWPNGTNGRQPPDRSPEPAMPPVEPEDGPAAHPSGEPLVECVFAGLLRSDVTCTRCGHTSTAFDPFRDVSLDLPVPVVPRPPQRTHGGDGSTPTPTPTHTPQLTPQALALSPQPAVPELLLPPAALGQAGGRATGRGFSASMSPELSADADAATGLTGALSGGDGSPPAEAGQDSAMEGPSQTKGSDSEAEGSEMCAPATSQSSLQLDAAARVAAVKAASMKGVVVRECTPQSTTPPPPALAPGAAGVVVEEPASQQEDEEDADDEGFLEATSPKAPLRGISAKQVLWSGKGQQQQQQHEDNEQEEQEDEASQLSEDSGLESGNEQSMSSPAPNGKMGARQASWAFDLRHCQQHHEQHAFWAAPGGLNASSGDSAMPDAAGPGAGAVAGGKGKHGRPPAAALRKVPGPRVQRCGTCHHCKNRHLKKGCMRNKAAKDATFSDCMDVCDTDTPMLPANDLPAPEAATSAPSAPIAAHAAQSNGTSAPPATAAAAAAPPPAAAAAAAQHVTAAAGPPAAAAPAPPVPHQQLEPAQQPSAVAVQQPPPAAPQPRSHKAAKRPSKGQSGSGSLSLPKRDSKGRFIPKALFARKDVLLAAARGDGPAPADGALPALTAREAEQFAELVAAGGYSAGPGCYTVVLTDGAGAAPAAAPSAAAPAAAAAAMAGAMPGVVLAAPDPSVASRGGSQEPSDAGAAAVAVAATATAAANAAVLAPAAAEQQRQQSRPASACGAPAAAAAKRPPPVPAFRPPQVSLLGCLRRYVRPEALTGSHTWRCEHCSSSEQALKQLSIRRLPPVLCLHIKRFAQTAHRVHKLDVPLAFPLHDLDMAPFLSTSVLRARCGARRRTGAVTRSRAAAAASEPCDLPAAAASKAGSAAAKANGAEKASGAKRKRAESDPGQQQDVAGDGGGDAAGDSVALRSMYELFGVVSHYGDMAGGHYVSYVKCGGCWYQCDDAWVRLVDEDTVAGCQAYMLWYAQKGFLGDSSSSGDGGEALAAAAAAAATMVGAAKAEAAVGVAAGVKGQAPGGTVCVKPEQ